ncbi:hypothetical protein [Desulfatirhabdium butyrativorans]|uniref:hypothetical protein n=1 Tax=Desulfatirhabdium butyrativorans TaxID=340467 RepID=UPI0004172AAE|nr:hypothetical protein [Desulfatirhabdium butyrativorans]
MLQLELTSKDLSFLSPLWQLGVEMDVRTGTTIRDILCRQVGIDDAYLDERIQTLFLNGKAIDDPDKAMVADKSTIALSAAMPGLAGATLRKGGSYASFRKAITDAACAVAADAHQQGTITLKLFNFIAQELAPILLRYGVKVEADALLAALKASRPEFPSIHPPGQSCRNLSELEAAIQGHRQLLLHLCT